MDALGCTHERLAKAAKDDGVICGEIAGFQLFHYLFRGWFTFEPEIEIGEVIGSGFTVSHAEGAGISAAIGEIYIEIIVHFICYGHN